MSDTRGRLGDDRYRSPNLQENACRKVAKSEGYTIGELFKDEDVSGGTMRRKELEKAIARVERGDSGGIIIAKLDRFARTLVGGLQTLERIKKANGIVVTADGLLDTGKPEDELRLNLMLSLAQFELSRIRETWETVKGDAVQRGIHISRYPPPGYRRDKKSRRLVPSRRHANAVGEAFEMAAAGESYLEIARHLTSAGVPSGGRKAVWHSHRVKRLLANRVYLGEARDGHGHVNPAAHDRLISDVTWNLAQREKRPAGVGKSKGVTLLAGLCRCASCSFAMRSQRGRAGSSVAVYRCPSTTVNGRCPHPTAISQVRLNEFVLQTFLSDASDMSAVVTEAEVSPIMEKITRAESSYRAAMDDVEYRAEHGPEAHKRLIAQTKQLWQELLAQAPTPSRLDDFDEVTLPEEARKLYAEGEIAELRELLASAIAAVFVRPAASRAKTLPVSDRVHIVYHGGDEAMELPKRGSRFEPRPYRW